jgi:FkbM family methyltransferase
MPDHVFGSRAVRELSTTVESPAGGGAQSARDEPRTSADPRAAHLAVMYHRAVRERVGWAHARARAAAAGREMKHLVSLASTRRERATMVGYIAKLYLARAMPFDTYGWNATVRLGGVRYTVGLRTSEIYVLGEIYEGRQYDRVPGYAPCPGWTVIDIGANVGTFTLHAARAGAHVYAFEPNPDCFARLQSNIRENGVESLVTLFQQAVSDTSGDGQMVVATGGTTGGTVTRGSEVSRGRVRITTLDEVVAPSPTDTIDLLKMDIEGAEVDALKGASDRVGSDPADHRRVPLAGSPR